MCSPRQSDFLLLSGINDNHDLIDGGKKGAIDDLEPGELEKFITKLGVRAYAHLRPCLLVELPSPGKHSEKQNKRLRSAFCCGKHFKINI